MVTPSNAQTTSTISDFIDGVNTRELEFREWIGGLVGGGRYSDGKYPLSNGLGLTTYTPCPAQIAHDASSGPGAAQAAAEAARDLAMSYRDTAQQQAVLAAASQAAAQAFRDQSSAFANASANAATLAGTRANAAAVSATASATSATQSQGFRDQGQAILNTANGVQTVILTANATIAANLLASNQAKTDAANSAATANAVTVGKLDTSAFTWANLPGKPTTFTPAGHTHAISEVVNLQSTLDGKLASTSYTASDVLAKLLTVDGAGTGLDADLLDGQQGSYYLSYANLTGKPTTFAPAAHTHAISDVTSLQPTLDGKLGVYQGIATGYAAYRFNSGNMDHTVGDGLFNIGGNMDHARMSNATATGHIASITGRGASRMGFHDSTINLYVASSDSLTAGQAITWVNTLNMTRVAANFFVQPQFNSVNLATANDLSSGLAGKQNVLGFAPMNSAGGTFTGTVGFTNGLQIGSGIATGFYGDGGNIAIRAYSGTSRIYFQNAGGIANFGDWNSAALTVSTPAVFGSTVTIGGATPWTSGNLNPATLATAQTFPNTIVKEFQTKAGDVLGSAVGQSYAGALGVVGPGSADGSNQALMSFHRPGAYAAHFGLNSSNRFVVGGWSMGNGVQKQLWIGGQIPSNSWERTQDGVGRFYFSNSSDSIYGTANNHYWRNGADATVMSLDGSGNVGLNGNVRASNTGGTGQFTAVSGSTMAGFYNDGTQFYILKSPSTSTGFDGHRPFYVNLVSGQVTIDGTAAGTTQIGGHLAVGLGIVAQGQISSGQYGVVGTHRADTGFGLRVRARSDDATGAVQFTNNAQSAEWTRLYSNGSGQLRSSTMFGVDGEFYANSWMRSAASGTGWYHEVHGGGFMMQDNQYVRIYNNKDLYTAGTVLAGAIQAGTVTATSDRKFKSHIRDLEPIAGLMPRRFVKDNRERLGYIAQEVQATAAKEAVHDQFDADGKHSLSLEPLAIIAAVHAQLEARIAALEAR